MVVAVGAAVAVWTAMAAVFAGVVAVGAALLLQAEPTREIPSARPTANWKREYLNFPSLQPRTTL
jgi:uncharacterized membrane protein